MMLRTMSDKHANQFSLSLEGEGSGEGVTEAPHILTISPEGRRNDVVPTGGCAS
jgi:hypothetical protein